jgi:hypothetical protein
MALVFRHSVITDGAMFGRPLWVTLSQISMRQEGVAFDTSEISFGFNQKQGLY